MDVAVASQQGNCAEFKHQIPHSCKKDPVIVDLMPEALADNRSEDCCRGGILEAWAINPSKSFSSFEIKVGNLEVNSSGYKPLNITLLAPGPGYTCSPMVDVDPSVSLVIGGRREIQVFMNLTVTIELSQLSSQELNNRLKDSEYITLQSLTETGSPTQINVETFAKFLHVHLMAVVIGSITNAALFRYLLHGLRLLHSLHDHASRQTKFEKVSTSMNDPCHDVFGISKETKDPRDVKGNRDLLDALPAKRKLEDGGYLSDDGPERAFTIGGKKGESSSAPRIIPGPAGKYQQAMARRERGKDIGDPVSTQEFLRAAMEEEEVDTDFDTPHWNNAIEAALMEGMTGDTEIVAMKRFSDSTRVQTVIAMIKECTPNGLGDAQLEL